MQSLKTTPRGTAASLGLALVMIGAPVGIGYQDLAALIARQPAVSEHWHDHLIGSPFGTIHTATFTFPTPIGMTIPDPLAFRLASLVSGTDDDITGSIAGASTSGGAPLVFPRVVRTGKGDRIDHQKGDRLPSPTSAPSHSAQPAPPGAAADAPAADPAKPAPTLAALDPSDVTPQNRATETSEATGPSIITMSAEAVEQVKLSAEALEADPELSQFDGIAPAFGVEPGPKARTSRLFFGVAPMGEGVASLEPWAPGEEPVLAEPAVDPDLKQSAGAQVAAVNPADANGESVASKGEVTGAGHRPKSPAERLGLVGPARTKAEKCLADAVYFEARGEPVRGQMAVAQVVMNRVFSGYYPGDVCGVVYQNANRHLACQFTFACDGIPERVTEPDAWARAKEIARDTLDGKIWVPDVGKATHYHAYWVHPRWVHEMKKMLKLGVHTFYRPRNWGDGSDAPVWGDPATTAELVKKL